MTDPASTAERAPLPLHGWEEGELDDPLAVVEADMARLMRELSESKLDAAQARRQGDEAQKRVLLELASACDAFARTLQLVETKTTEGFRLEPPVKTWVANFKTTFKLLRRILTDNEVVELAPAPNFDPHLHRILELKREAGMLEGAILKTTLPGYRWKGQVLRKADVVVVRNHGLLDESDEVAS